MSSQARPRAFSAPSCYFVNGRLLLRKWARVVNGVQIDKVVQGMAGHLGVKKTYNRVLRLFFPGLT